MLKLLNHDLIVFADDLCVFVFHRQHRLLILKKYLQWALMVCLLRLRGALMSRTCNVERHLVVPYLASGCQLRFFALVAQQEFDLLICRWRPVPAAIQSRRRVYLTTGCYRLFEAG
jgi:hypothetical protein